MARPLRRPPHRGEAAGATACAAGDGSFGLEAGDGVEPGGLAGGLEAEEEAGRGGGAEPACHRHPGDQELPAGEAADRPCRHQAKQDTEQAAGFGLAGKREGRLQAHVEIARLLLRAGGLFEFALARAAGEGVTLEAPTERSVAGYVRDDDRPGLTTGRPDGSGRQ